MLYVILLLILTVLLFGSSAVIGFFGYVLGFAAALAALVYAKVTFNLDPGLTIGLAVIGFFVLCGAIMIIARILEPFERIAVERRIASRLAERRSK